MLTKNVAAKDETIEDLNNQLEYVKNQLEEKNRTNISLFSKTETIQNELKTALEEYAII